VDKPVDKVVHQAGSAVHGRAVAWDRGVEDTPGPAVDTALTSENGVGPGVDEK
jgi:hypothetical protein